MFNFNANIDSHCVVSEDVTISQKYSVWFDFNTLEYTANTVVCSGNFLVNNKFVFLTPNEIVLTQNSFGWNGTHQKAFAVYSFLNKTLVSCDTSATKDALETLRIFKDYISKYENLFYEYLNVSYKKQVHLLHIPWHIGHDIVDEIIRWDTLRNTFNVIKIVKHPLFFRKQDVLHMFKLCDIFDAEEELFYDICVSKYMLYRVCCRTQQFSNNIIKNAFLPMGGNTSTNTVGIILKEDKMYKNCLNNYDFLIKLCDFLISKNFFIEVIGYLELYQDLNSCFEKKYAHTRNHMKSLVSSLEKYYINNESISFSSNLNITDFAYKAINFKHYVSLPGSLQHVTHFFAYNIKKALVCGDVNNTYFTHYQKLMGYNTLPIEYIEYYDINNVPITDLSLLHAKNYNFKIKLDDINTYFTSFFN